MSKIFIFILMLCILMNNKDLFDLICFDLYLIFTCMPGELL